MHTQRTFSTLNAVMMALAIIVICSSRSMAQPVRICDDETEFPPYLYWERINGKADHTKLRGATVDLVQEIFALVKLEYTLDLIPWKRCLAEVENFGTQGNYEVFTDGSYNLQRAEKYYVTAPIYKTHEGLWYSQQRFPQPPTIAKAQDLNPFRVCGVVGNNYEWLIKQPGMSLQLDTAATSPAAALEKVARGRCDFFVAGLENTYGGERTGQFTIPSDVVGIPFPGGREPTFHMFVAKTSPRAYELYTRINQAILWLQYNGIADAIYQKYLPGGDGL